MGPEVDWSFVFSNVSELDRLVLHGNEHRWREGTRTPLFEKGKTAL